MSIPQSSEQQPDAACEFDEAAHALVVRLSVERFADAEATAAKQAITEKLRTCRYRLVVDLTPVAYVASTGLGVLVALRDLVMKHGGALSVFGAHPGMAETFRLTHLDEALNLRSTRDEALAAVA
ncbi:MAG: STAS domain-containing protein [Planctomycetota bacterium]